ncbi:MAG: hypothetical protein KJ566_02145 [Nanoarchaeota archaeon]|nr:hypothetical protein [Nanoarchaeota archaeon]
MGFIRGSLLVLVSFLLFLTFLISNVLLTATLTVDYENLQEDIVPVLVDVVEDQVNFSETLVEGRNFVEEYCNQNSKIVLGEGDFSLEIPCQNTSGGFDSALEQGISDAVDEIYYEEYDCEFWDCLKQGDPLFLVSEKTHDYLKSKFLQSFLVIGVLLILIFLLVVKKSNTLILAGSLLIGSSIPFLGLQKLTEFLLTKDILKFIGILFSKVNLVFWISFITGIVLLAVGISFRIFGIGLRITEKFSQKKQEETKDKKEKPSDKKLEKPKEVSIEKVEKQANEKVRFMDKLKKKLGKK